MSDLPKEYDVIIGGTGLTESILAAAFSRIGKTVLHLDRNQFYGGEFSSHTLTTLTEWTDRLYEQKTTEAENEDIQENTIRCNNDLSKFITKVDYEWNPNLSEEDKNKILSLSRKFSIDLAPNIFYSRGDFIELLISSDVSKYCEFRLVNQILTKNENNLEKVPTSRSEVFKTNQLSMIEKRVMMQFIQSCMKDNNFEDLLEPNKAATTTFKEFIQSKKFSKSITNYLLNAVSMCPNDSQNALDGLKQVKKFLSSVDRFGNSPFLFSLYGTGELSQCFCRMAAVFGGIYHLSLPINNISFNAETNLIESVNARTDSVSFNFKCTNLILDCSYAPLEYLKSNIPCEKISRCILITDKSIFPTEDREDNISLLYLPKSELNNSSVYCLEASYASQCCPQGYYLVYLFCENTNESAKNDFDNIIKHLFVKKVPDSTSEFDTKDENKNTNILFSYYFSHLDSNNLIQNLSSKLPDNLFLVGGSKASLDFDYNVEQAKAIFKKICPTEEFLPKPPDQEDIIFDDNAASTAINAENVIVNEQQTLP